jgi:hypothetical protein
MQGQTELSNWIYKVVNKSGQNRQKIDLMKVLPDICKQTTKYFPVTTNL